MGLVFGANNKSSVQCSKTVIRHLLVKELTSVNREFLESLGISVTKNNGNVGR